MDTRHIILVEDQEGNVCAVVCKSYDAAADTREVLESKGIETFGIRRVLTVAQAKTEGK